MNFTSNAARVAPARRDVAAICFRYLLDGAERLGVSPGTLIEGLDIRREDLGASPTRRYPWDDYVEITERLSAALGGDQALFDSAGIITEVLPEAAVLCSLFVHPRTVYRFVYLVADHAVLPTVRNELHDLPDGRLRLRMEILPGYRESSAYHYASVGAVPVISTYIGLPASEVEVVAITPRYSECIITLPRTRTLLSQARQPILLFKQALAQLSSDGRELAGAIRAIAPEMPGTPLSRRHLAAVPPRRRLEDVLRGVLGSISNAAFVVSPDGISPANASGSVALEREGDALRAELESIGLHGAVPDGFEVTQLDHPRHFLLVRKGIRDEFHRRLEHRRALWSLSPRQKEILGTLVEGLSNAEIAGRFACTVRTVETHVTALLERADVQSRLELVAAFWTDP